MYVFFIFLIVLIVPPPVMIRSAMKGATPYRAVLDGVIAVAVGTVFIFILAAASGQPVGEELKIGLYAAAEILVDNQSVTSALGIADLPYDQRLAVFNTVYDYAVNIFPASIIIWAMPVAYFEYLILAKLINRKQPKFQKLPAFREFGLPRNALIGFIIIFILSWLVMAIGIVPNDTIYENVNLLFEFVFAIQGAAVLFFFCYTRRIPKVVAIIVTILLFNINAGQMVLFLLGITDLAFGLKGRMGRKLDK